VALVERLHDLGGTHGVGRIDHVEDRLVGIKSREIYEAPAAVNPARGAQGLEGLSCPGSSSGSTGCRGRAGTDHLRRPVVQRPVAGTSPHLRHVIAARCVRRRADAPGPRSGDRDRRRLAALAVRQELATYDEGDAFDHATAVGFIEIFGLPLRVEAARHGAVGKPTAQPGRGRSPCSPTCRRRSPKAPPRQRAEPRPPIRGVTAAPGCRVLLSPVTLRPAPTRASTSSPSLHELAQLATQARDWDELMRTLVDRTTVAMHFEVCSFYLLHDRIASA